MKFNWKVIVALLIIPVVIYWAISSTATQTLSGAEITLNMGSGPVTIHNPSETAAAAVFSTTGTRGAFTIGGSVLDAPVASTRTGSGRTQANIVELELPQGTSEVFVARGSGVSLTLTGEAPLEVTVKPVSDSEARTTYIAAALISIAALVFVSFTTNHAWLKRLRGKKSTDATAGKPASALE